MFYSLLLNDSAPVSDWLSRWFPIIQTIIIILITILAIVIIVSILAQPSKPAGGNVITGNNYDSYFSHNKGHTKEGRLNKIIIISAISIFVLTILYFISFMFYRGGVA